MSDLMAKCDWRGGTLSIVLPEDPERIAVRLFDSRQAPARLYVPKVDVLRQRNENDRLRELVRELLSGYACGRGNMCDECTWDGLGDPHTFACPVRVRARELGIEVG